ncbi:MAG: class II aldolase/adducin family protein, partial [Rhodospirillales bacterium]
MKLNDIKQARTELAAAYRLAEKQGFNEGICNHFTMMVPGTDDRFLLIPYGMHWSEVTASNLIEVNFDGTVIDDGGYADNFDNELIVDRSALCIHAPVHQARSDARCVLHTHMPYATALTMLDDFRFPMASQNELGFYGRIAYDDDYNGVAHDHDEGHRMAKVLGSND